MSECVGLPSSLLGLESLRVSIAASIGECLVVEVCINRPQKLNALGAAFWREFPLCMRTLDHWSPCRCVILTGEGPAFCSGIDLSFLQLSSSSPPPSSSYSHSHSHFSSSSSAAATAAAAGASTGAHEQQQRKAHPQKKQQQPAAAAAAAAARGEEDPLVHIFPLPEEVGRRGLRLQQVVSLLQRATAAAEEIRKPVIAAVCGPCIGAGVGLLCACDIRLAAADAAFCVKEIDLGLPPDTGVLQRLPLLVRSSSWAREVCLSTRFFFAAEAEKEGFVSAVYPDKETLINAAVSLGLTLAQKSPLAIAAAKQALNYSRGRPIEEGLQQQIAASALLLQTRDIFDSICMQTKHKNQTKRTKLPPFAGL